MKKQLDTIILFNDLKDTYSEFQKAYSPKQVRRLFSIFLIQSKQLTELMRREYKIKTRQQWRATDFTGWTATSDFFYKLRNVHLHEVPVKINVHVKSYHKFTCPDFPADIPSFCVEATILIDDQLVDNNPPPMILCRPEEAGKEEILSEVYAVEYSYVISPEIMPDKKLKDELTVDLRILLDNYYNTLCSYYEFYTSELFNPYK